MTRPALPFGDWRAANDSGHQLTAVHLDHLTDDVGRKLGRGEEEVGPHAILGCAEASLWDGAKGGVKLGLCGIALVEGRGDHPQPR